MDLKVAMVLSSTFGSSGERITCTCKGVGVEGGSKCEAEEARSAVERALQDALQVREAEI